MERRLGDIEYEQMLQSRYVLAQHRHAGAIERSVYVVLSRISVDGPMTIAELSDAMRLDASTLQRQTSAALKAGLLERIADPDGGLARKFTVTEAGAMRMRATRDYTISRLEDILRDWPSSDVNTFAELLHRFNVDIERHSAAVFNASRAVRDSA